MRILSTFNWPMILRPTIRRNGHPLLRPLGLLFAVTLLVGGAPLAARGDVSQSPLSLHIQQLIAHVRANAGRAEEVVVQQVLPEEAVPGVNPRAGKPVRVVHIDPSAAPGGNGSFERPLQTLADFQKLSPEQRAAYDIIYVHGSGGIHLLDEPLHLDPWQRLLSDSVAHSVETRGGSIALPGYNPLNAPPTIMSYTGDVIQLSHNNEISGFYIDAGRNQTGSAIVGNGVTGFNINRNEIRNGINGIAVTTSTPLGFNSSGVVRDNSFENFTNDAVHITHVGPGTMNLQIESNIATRNLGHGFNITADGAPMNLNVIGNTATNNGTAFVVNSLNGATIDAIVENNNFSGSTGTRGSVSPRPFGRTAVARR